MNTSAYYTYLLLILKSVVYFIIITFSVCLEEAFAVMERARDIGDHKRVNFPSSSIPKILYFLAGFGLSQFIGVFTHYFTFR